MTNWTKPEAYGDPATLRRDGLAKGDAIDQPFHDAGTGPHSFTIVDLSNLFTGKQGKRD